MMDANHPGALQGARMKKEGPMSFREVPVESLSFNPFGKISKEWMLVTAGTPERVNTMTASWGAVGVWWGKPAATCYIRETRYTKEFVDVNDRFTLSFFGDGCRDALKLCGAVSGRDRDKIAEAGLTVAFDGDAPYFEQARTVFVCRKALALPMPKDSFVDADAYDNWYTKGALADNFHTMYIGTIEKVLVRD
jgi:flavin reductase (DIM6/NTAB) family NADH-FMN oxidoreductase RutF